MGTKGNIYGRIPYVFQVGKENTLLIISDFNYNLIKQDKEVRVWYAAILYV